MKRRTFLSFFVAGGIVSLLKKKAKAAQAPKKAMYWRRMK